MSGDFDPYHKWLGIPPHERPLTLYRLLGLGEGEADPDVIDAAADRMMQFLRSQSGGQHTELAEKVLGEIASARLVLLDPEKRRRYEARRAQMRAERQARERVPSPSDPAPPSNESTSGSPSRDATSGSPSRDAAMGTVVTEKPLGGLAGWKLAVMAFSLLAVTAGAGALVWLLLFTDRAAPVALTTADAKSDRSSADRDGRTGESGGADVDESTDADPANTASPDEAEKDTEDAASERTSEGPSSAQGPVTVAVNKPLPGDGITLDDGGAGETEAESPAPKSAGDAATDETSPDEASSAEPGDRPATSDEDKAATSAADSEDTSSTDEENDQEAGPPAPPALAKHGLQRHDDVWRLTLEDDLAAFLDTVEERMQAIDDFEANADVVAFRRQFAKLKEEFERRDREFKLEREVRAYKGFGDKDEVDDFNFRILPEFETFFNEKWQPAAAQAANLDANRKQLVDQFVKVFVLADNQVTTIAKKYRDVRKDAEALAVVAQEGGRLGPDHSFAQLRARLREAGKRANVLKIKIKGARSAGADFDVDIEIPTAENIDPAVHPVEYLTARSLREQDGQWILQAEDESKKRLDELKSFDAEAKSIRNELPARRRREQEKRKLFLQEKRRQLDAEHQRIRDKVMKQQNGRAYQDDLDNLKAWQDKKRKELAYELKVQAEDASILDAEGRLAYLLDDREAFLEKAVSQALTIAERYGDLAADEDVTKALQALGQELGPSESFQANYTKLRREHRKAQRQRR
ncbi:MAG: hypothetical protein DWQ31_10510 [Planctomycetota bacterium]|nr:MAG: hypothetical protein DWQ31_10510 [Planctomycetota bacterium]